MRTNPFLWLIPYNNPAKASLWLSAEKKNFGSGDMLKGFSEKP
jgi:hypothetical protein